jgi:hypothetical protein
MCVFWRPSSATQVETALLLHDALYPDQPVREDTARSETKRQWQMPRVSQPFLQVEVFRSDDNPQVM